MANTNKARTRYIIVLPRNSGSTQYVAMNAIVGTIFSSGSNDGVYDSLQLMFPGVYDIFPDKRMLVAEAVIESLSYAANVSIKNIDCQATPDERPRVLLLTVASSEKSKDISHLIVLEKYLPENDILDLPSADGSGHPASSATNMAGGKVAGPGQQEQKSAGYIYMPKHNVPLILGEHEANVLQDVLDAIVNRKKIFEDYGLDEVMDTNSMCFLFHGAPGTGKTQAAKYVAKKLNTPLLIVDHSQIVDKYVGETEKRIAEVFKRAETEKCIIFFDEADSLLGARNGAEHSWEISKVNALLQSMENFNGVAIFATNYASQLDQAVNRRLLMKITFDLPDQESRAKIWEALLPTKAPKDALDFKELSKHLMTGGEIKNAVISATVEVAKTDAKINMDSLNRMAAKVIEERLFDPYKESDKEKSKKNMGFGPPMMELK